MNRQSSEDFNSSESSTIVVDMCAIDLSRSERWTKMMPLIYIRCIITVMCYSCMKNHAFMHFRIQVRDCETLMQTKMKESHFEKAGAFCCHP